jgi:iron complex transport system substrate-binding protein
MLEVSAFPFARRTVSRRGLLAGAGGLGLGVLAAACGAGETDPGTASGAGNGQWSFTDDRGTKVTTEGRPNRVVAYVGSAAALYDFGVNSSLVGVFGPTKLNNDKADPLAGDLDIGKLTIVGNTYGEFNVEKYATLRPDLLVTNMMQPSVLWYVPSSSESCDSRRVSRSSPRMSRWHRPSSVTASWREHWALTKGRNR